MQLALWRFLTLLFAALSMGLSFCHLMEMSARLSWEPAFWMAVTNPPNLLYRNFGRTGAVIDVGAVIASWVLVFMVRRRQGSSNGGPAARRDRRHGLVLTLAGACLLALGLAAWWAVVFPMNQAMVGWAAPEVPADFLAVRNQWEYGHAAIAAIKMLALAALLASVLAETPRDQEITGAGAALRRPLA